MKQLILAGTMLFALSLSAQRPKEGGMVTVYVPDTVYLKEKVTVHVTYSGGTNGCAKGHKVKVKNKKDRKVYLTPYYIQKKGSNCALNIPTHSDTFTFKAKKPGIYMFYRYDGDIMPAATTIVLKRTKGKRPDDYKQLTM